YLQEAPPTLASPPSGERRWGPIEVMRVVLASRSHEDDLDSLVLLFGAVHSFAHQWLGVIDVLHGHWGGPCVLEGSFSLLAEERRLFCILASTGVNDHKHRKIRMSLRDSSEELEDLRGNFVEFVLVVQHIADIDDDPAVVPVAKELPCFAEFLQ